MRTSSSGKVLSLLFCLICGTGLASCCEPATKDSRPIMVDSLFDRQTGWDLDLQRTTPGATPDSGYYPIYTVAIKNAGSQDDMFTLRFRSQYRLVDGSSSGAPLGFDITQRVPANSVVLFRTPTPTPDSITSRETITYTPSQDTLPLMSRAYYGFFATTPDSTKLRFEHATLSVIYGAIDNGSEGCNTPASETQLSTYGIEDK